jgi:translocation and assembly module TamA
MHANGRNPITPSRVRHCGWFNLTYPVTIPENEQRADLGERDIMGLNSFVKRLSLSVFAATLASVSPVVALDEIQFNVAGEEALGDELRDASLLLAAEAEGRTDPRDLLATSLAEYERLLNTLYAEGHYGAVINIRVDGREAAAIPNYSVPDAVRRITVDVRPGQQFHFGRTQITPLVRGTRKIDEFRAGEPAYSTVVGDAVDSAVEDWREAGRAKARVRDQDITANHATELLNAQVWIDPGPLVKFGDLVVTRPSYVRTERIRTIAGLPSGKVFSPEELERAADRLRRTGAFASVVLREAEDLGSGNSMDIRATVADMKPRRFGFGAEISSLEGLGLTGFWMHRNLFGGAERFRFDAAANGITPSLANLDIELAARLDIPAAFGTDNDAFVMGEAAMLREPTFTAWTGEVGAGVKRYFSEDLVGEIGLGYSFSRVTDSQGTRNFNLVKVPAMIEWDRRNDPLRATRGFYVRADVEPFYELTNGFGVWGKLDGRVYQGFGEDDRFVVAARLQAGMVVGPTPAQTHPDFLFYSGGGGTVRGQPYQALSFPAGGGNRIGGQAFAGGQFELRVKATDTIGVVGFFDVGYLGANGFFGGPSAWHSGAGIGLRYDTGLGPIRLDVAYPVTGGTRSPNPLRNVQLYVGIGHAF